LIGLDAVARGSPPRRRCLKQSARPAEHLTVYTSTTIADPSPRAEALSGEVLALLRERRGQDPNLGVLETLVALELVKASLLEESGVASAGRRTVVVVAVALSVAVAAFMLFFMSR
jgi:hypothetical protein